MLLYTTVGADDFNSAVRFYDAIFDALGQDRLPDASEGWAGWGKPYDSGFSFWICPPFDSAPAKPGNGVMFAFRATSAAEVRAFHAAGIAHGGQDEGPPGIRDYYEPDFYVAYLRDPHGNKLAAVFHRYDPAKDQA